jgi:lysophospholipase L1-like esterase
VSHYWLTAFTTQTADVRDRANGTRTEPRAPLPEEISRMTTRGSNALLATFAAVALLIVSVVLLAGFGEGLANGAKAEPDATDPTDATDTNKGTAGIAPVSGWIGTWATAPAAAEPRTSDGLPGRSIRNVVHTSIGGTAARVTLSNLYGRKPLSLSSASLAVAEPASGTVGGTGGGTVGGTGGGAAAVPGSMRRLTFGGSAAVVIPAGHSVRSDPVKLTVPADADLLVTTYTDLAGGGPVTYHPFARQISYLGDGDHVLSVSPKGYTEESQYWRYVTGVDVRGSGAKGALVFLGDSITDGVTSTVGANLRWPDQLAEQLRLRDRKGRLRYGILNEGISGNQVLTDSTVPQWNAGGLPDNQSGLARFDRDVLTRSGARTVVIALGVNDVLKGKAAKDDPERIVAGLRTLTERAHGQGLRVVGATLMPFGGHRGYTDRREAVRVAVNGLIRQGGVFDQVVDFDAALRDTGDGERFRAEYDSGDHLHPSDAGYLAMAVAFDRAVSRRVAG